MTTRSDSPCGSLHATTGACLIASFAAGLIGCAGEVVDLGANGLDSDRVHTNPIAGDAQSTVVRVVDRERFGCDMSASSAPIFAVDAGKLYWLSPTEGSDHSMRYTLRSCVVEHCSDSLQILSSEENQGYDCEVASAANVMQVDGDNVFWSNPDLLQTTTRPIVSASKSIPGGSSYVDFSAPPGATYEVANGMLYVASPDNTLVQCHANDCTNTAVRYSMTATANEQTNAPVLVAEDAGYLYLSDVRFESPAPGTSGWRLLRVAKDPSASLEVILPTWPTFPGGLTLHGDNLYWVEETSSAQLLTCPKTGCAAGPKVLATGFEQPAAIAADDQYLYVLEPPQHSTPATPNDELNVTRLGRISRCSLTGCSEPTVIYTSTTEIFMSQLKVDDRFIYFSGKDCGNETGFYFAPCAFIAAIPKPS